MKQRFKTIEIIGVPSDLGANMRGACMGPAAIRIAGLNQKIRDLGYDVIDTGDIPVPIRDSLSGKDATEHYVHQIARICEKLCERTESVMNKGHLPIILGGDHSIAIGTIAGASAHYHKKNQKMGLIWVDAHADMNTPQSSPSCNIHGMPVSTVLGHGFSELTSIGGNHKKVAAENTVLIGLRTIDKVEKEILRKSGVTYFTMRDIDEMSMYKVMNEAMQIAGDGTEGIHLSFDLDGVDPQFAPGVSTPVMGGLNFREAHLVPEMLHESGKLTSIEFVELNPLSDVSSKSTEFMINLIESALGKTIV